MTTRTPIEDLSTLSRNHLLVEAERMARHIERILRRGLLRFDRSRRNHATRVAIKDRLREIRKVGAK